jgi:glycerate kinase
LRDLNVDADKIPGSGAAGGFGAGLIAFCDATIVPGIDYILELLRFDEMLDQCDAVVTAEGSLDEQTGLGKGIAGVALRARKWKVPVHVFAGRVKGDARNLSHQLGVESINEISPSTIDDREGMRRAAELLSAAVKKAVAGW